MHPILQAKLMTPEEVASLIQDDEIIACSGFTPAGYPKKIPPAIAARGKKMKEQGYSFGLTLYTGASVGDELDGEWARAGITKKRLPYQSNALLREQINAGQVEFMDYHLSGIPQHVRSGYLRKPTTAIVEACDVTPDGKVYLSTSGGATASYLLMADRVFIEWNSFFGESLKGFHDVYIPEDDRRRIIPLYEPGDRIGLPYVQVPLHKIAGIVLTELPDRGGEFKEPDDECKAIACHILDFLKHERKCGRLPAGLPYQSGVGNIANAVLACMAEDQEVDPFSLYTEVVQDSIFKLIDHNKLQVASTSALTFSPEGQRRFKRDIDQFRRFFIIRQQEITNSPEVIHRLGLVSMNTALEMDYFGNVNSTHVFGSQLMNGIGGSADFTRNCFLPIFMSPSSSKGGKISNIVPMVTHTDQSEHSTQIFVTEQGLADLRGLSPVAKAREIIKKCAHPRFKAVLTEQLESGLSHAPGKQVPIDLRHVFDLHLNYLKNGDMLNFT